VRWSVPEPVRCRSPETETSGVKGSRERLEAFAAFFYLVRPIGRIAIPRASHDTAFISGN
jgi:hypothetical protein